MTHFCWETIWNVLSQLISFTIVKFFYILFTTFKAFYHRQIPSVTTANIELIGNRTSCRPVRSVIILVIKQIRLSLRGRPILFITRMITDRIGLHSVLLPLLIKQHKSPARGQLGAVINWAKSSCILSTVSINIVINPL